MNRAEYNKAKREYNEKIENKFEEDLRKKVKNWSRGMIIEEYVASQKARLSIAPYPPYDWFQILDEKCEDYIKNE